MLSCIPDVRCITHNLELHNSPLLCLQWPWTPYQTLLVSTVNLGCIPVPYCVCSNIELHIIPSLIICTMGQLKIWQNNTNNKKYIYYAVQSSSLVCNLKTTTIPTIGEYIISLLQIVRILQWVPQCYIIKANLVVKFIIAPSWYLVCIDWLSDYICMAPKQARSFVLNIINILHGEIKIKK